MSETFSNTNKNDSDTNKNSITMTNTNSSNNTTKNNSNDTTNDKTLANALPYLGLINPESLNYEYISQPSDTTSYSIANITQFIQSSTIFTTNTTKTDASETITNAANEMSNVTNNNSANIPTTNRNKSSNNNIKNMNKLYILYSQNLSQVDRYELAYQLAKKLGHKHIEAILAERIYNQ